MFRVEPDYFESGVTVMDPEIDAPLARCRCRGCESEGYYPPGEDCLYG